MVERRQFLKGLAFSSLIFPQREQAPPRFIEVSQPRTVFERSFEPFREEALRKRAQRANEHHFQEAIDLDLNKNRINFLLFGHGITDEPPHTVRPDIGNFTIASLNLQTGKIDMISFTHDIRSPEVARYKRKAEDAVVHGAIKIDQAWRVGGFPLIGEVMENASGLVMDYKTVFRDCFIQKAIDELFDGLEIDLPFDLDLNQTYIDETFYPAKSYKKGKVKLNGSDVVNFIKTVVKEDKPKKETEHKARMHLVVDAVQKRLEKDLKNPFFLRKAVSFMREQKDVGNVFLDFDPEKLLFDNFWNLSASMLTSLWEQPKSGMPEFGQKIYIVDKSHGDGGVIWVPASSHYTTVSDLAMGVYPDRAMEVPIGGNPYAENLALDYWFSVRRLIKDKIS